MPFHDENRLDWAINFLDLYHVYREWRLEMSKTHEVEPEPTLPEFMAWLENAVQNAQVGKEPKHDPTGKTVRQN